MARKSAPDWDAIRRDWRTGQFSEAELSRIHGVQQSTISRKRKAQTAAGNKGWGQDLAAAVRARIDNDLQRDAAQRAGAEPQRTRGKQRADKADSRVHARDPSPIEPKRSKASKPVRQADQVEQVEMPPPPAPPPSDAEIVAAAARRGADVVRGHRSAAERLKGMFDRLSDAVDRRLQSIEARVAAGEVFAGDVLADTAEVLDTMARSLARITTVERQAYALDGKAATPTGLEEDKGVLSPEQRVSALAAVRARMVVPAVVSEARH